MSMFDEFLALSNSTDFNESYSSDKLEIIKEIVDRYTYKSDIARWDTAISVFEDSNIIQELYYLAAHDLVSKYANSNEVTDAYRADMALMAIDRYGKFVDIKSIMLNVYGDKYQTIEDIMISHLKKVNEMLKRNFNVEDGIKIDNFIFNNSK